MPEPFISKATARAVEAMHQGSWTQRSHHTATQCQICGNGAFLFFEDDEGTEALCIFCMEGLALLVLRRPKTGEARIEAPPAREAGPRTLFEVQPSHQDPA